MKVFIPNSAYIQNFDSFIKRFDAREKGKLEIATHDKWVNVHPAILTLTAALALEVGLKNVSIDEVTAASGHYLDRMGLFDLINKNSPCEIEKHESAGKFIPLTIIKNQAEQSKFITDMIPMLHLPADKAVAIRYAFGELVRNVLEHSKSVHGAVVAAQYYQKSNVIRLGICDTGIGVWQSIVASWPAKTNLDALHLAIQPGITGTTKLEGGTEDNAGAGLFFIKSMSAISRNYFLMYSGTAIYRLLKRRKTVGLPKLNADPAKDRHSSTNTAPNFNGTLVAVDISLDEAEEFTAILGAIREAYSASIKERKKARYKKPQFI